VTVGAEPRRWGGFHPNVVALGLTSFFTDISTEMLVPVMPLFITATLGASVASLGLIEGIAECTPRRCGSWRAGSPTGSARRKPFLGRGLRALGRVQDADGVRGLVARDAGLPLRRPRRQGAAEPAA
jgi:hypothetical protein